MEGAGWVMSMEKIYVIEDDENIRELVKVALEGYGYEVQAFGRAEDALQAMGTDRPDLAIFDLMLPGMDGLSAIRQLRREKEFGRMPMMVLTAKDKEYDKVTGLDGGADDYMTKPFGVMELAARVRSLLRRAAGEAAEKGTGRERYGKLEIDKAAREVYMEGQGTELTFKEYELLVYLVKNRMRVVPREELLERLWDYNAEVETRTLDIHIRTLRQKLGKEGGGYIRTVRSVGYRFVPEQDAQRE